VPVVAFNGKLTKSLFALFYGTLPIF